MNSIYNFFVKFILLLSLATFYISCSPAIYKKQVGEFSTGVQNATSAFNKLRQDSMAQDIKLKEETFQSQLTPFGVSQGCYEITDVMQKQASCYASWAKYRAAVGEKPTQCVELNDFYQLPPESKNCIMGPLDSKGTIVGTPFLLDPVLTNTSLMSDKLSSYAIALTEIVDSKDMDDLTTAIADAKKSITETAESYDKLNKQKPEKLEAFGPISELFSFIATTSLDTQRFNALKKTVNAADPVVEAASKRLSINIMPLLLKTKIRPNQLILNKAADEFAPNLISQDNYSQNLKAIRDAFDNYMKNFNKDASSVFRAMALAHKALKDALNDPKTQFENMQDKVKKFYDIAKDVNDTFEKKP